MDVALVLAAGFRIARAQRHVEGTADLLIEQDALGEAIDLEVGADGKFSNIARTRVCLQHLQQKFLIFCCTGLHDFAIFELELDPVHDAPLVHRRVGIAHPTVGRRLPQDRCRSRRPGGCEYRRHY